MTDEQVREDNSHHFLWLCLTIRRRQFCFSPVTVLQIGQFSYHYSPVTVSTDGRRQDRWVRRCGKRQVRQACWVSTHLRRWEAWGETTSWPTSCMRNSEYREIIFSSVMKLLELLQMFYFLTFMVFVCLFICFVLFCLCVYVFRLLGLIERKTVDD